MQRSSLAPYTVCCLVTALVPACTARGAVEKPATSLDPEAQAVVRRLADYIRRLQSFRVDLAVSMKLTAPGMKQEVVSAYSLSVRRPDRLALVLKDSVMGTTIVSDGTTVSTCTPMEGKYRQTSAPKDLADVIPRDSMVGPPIFGSPTFAGRLLYALLADKPYEALMEDVTACRDLGTENVGGAPCRHLEFSGNNTTWYVWVEAGEKPLIRRIAPDIPAQVARFARTMPGIRNELKLDAAITFDHWVPDAKLPDSVFQFTPPPGVTLTQSPPGEDAPDANETLVGKPAPNIRLSLLDGGQLDLAALKDKIVILDFWATWCGPCQMSMPVLIELANDYKAKGVVFYTINLQEPPEKIRDFLKQKKWAIPVALDKTGLAAENYVARGIPLTVIVGKDGTVQAMHEGFDPDMKAGIKKDLDALLAGKTLAPKK